MDERLSLSSRQRRRHTIKRPRLARLIADADSHVVLLTGPAGYGKTTFAEEWAATFAQACWYRSRSSSNDLAALGTGVAIAMERVVPGVAERMAHQLARPPAKTVNLPHSQT